KKANQLRNLPYMIRQASLHRRSNAQGLMNLAKVVVREVQREVERVHLKFLTEAISQSSEPTHLHADREVVAFDVRRRHETRIGVARYSRALCAHQLCRRVATARTRSGVRLLNDAEINVYAEGFIDCADVVQI